MDYKQVVLEILKDGPMLDYDICVRGMDMGFQEYDIDDAITELADEGRLSEQGVEGYNTIWKISE